MHRQWQCISPSSGKHATLDLRGMCSCDATLNTDMAYEPFCMGSTKPLTSLTMAMERSMRTSWSQRLGGAQRGGRMRDSLTGRRQCTEAGKEGKTMLGLKTQPRQGAREKGRMRTAPHANVVLPWLLRLPLSHRSLRLHQVRGGLHCDRQGALGSPASDLSGAKQCEESAICVRNAETISTLLEARRTRHKTVKRMGQQQQFTHPVQRPVDQLRLARKQALEHTLPLGPAAPWHLAR